MADQADIKHEKTAKRAERESSGVVNAGMTTATPQTWTHHTHNGAVTPPPTTRGQPCRP